MTIVRKKGTVDVVQAAKNRIKQAALTGKKIYLSFSGGKDSICLANLIYRAVVEGVIDPKKLEVVFIDEEAVFSGVEESVKEWRSNFLILGVTFSWFCLQVKHFSCFNRLTSDETFICWDINKRTKWVRSPPKFAIMSHPLLNSRRETYQSFLIKYMEDGISLIGLRASESVQRLFIIASMYGGDSASSNKNYPIYDWKDDDVWLYIKNENLSFPVEYLNLYQIGMPRSKMRLSQFFSSDTAGVLPNMQQFDPTLLERVIKREPNARLALFYWDTELFGNSSKTRTISDKNKTDYKEESLKMLHSPLEYFKGEVALKTAKRYLKLVIKDSHRMRAKEWKRIYNALVGGDPKRRTYRAILTDIGINSGSSDA